MRRVVVILSALAVAAGCDDCVEEPVVNVGEGEGEALPVEGEGEEGEGETGEGEGEEGEGEGEEGEGEGEGEVCVVGDLIGVGGDDKPRGLLIAFPFAESGGAADVVRSYVVGVDGSIGDEADRVNVGFRPDRIAFANSGTLAVVVGESLPPAGGGQRDPDQVATLDVSDPANLRILDIASSGVFGMNDLVASTTVRGGGVVFYAVNFDSGTGSTPGAVSVVIVGCDGSITVDRAASLDLRLSSSMALLPNDRAFLVGGQAGFGVPDVDDVRLLGVAGGEVADLFDFNFFPDDTGVIADKIGVAVDGSFVVVPNGSLDRAEVAVFDIAGDVVTRRGGTTAFGGTQALVAPDGTVAAVSNFEDNALHILDVTGAGDPTEVRALNSLGLCDQLTMIERGALAGRVFAPVTDGSNPGGSFVVSIQLGEGDAVRDPERFALGTAIADLPGAIAIAP